MFIDFYKGKKVLVTGGTGFKGAWLCEWLLMLGATVSNYSLEAPTEPSLFNLLDLEKRLTHQQADIRHRETLLQAIKAFKPDVVFHLAAQSLVRRSYQNPVDTFETNVMGTVNLMEALRQSGQACSVVVVTTDKCYENREWNHGYREEDALGGYDPYSASKACAEHVVAAYRRSFFNGAAGSKMALATARAGNVIGGGDWAADRIIPDCIRSLQNGQAIRVRNKTATRPWQHVLEPLGGYLWLACQQSRAEIKSFSELPQWDRNIFSTAFNFGPGVTSNRTVEEVVRELLKYCSGSWEDASDPQAPHEAGKLHLSVDKAYHLLGWHPVWDFAETVKETALWYKNHLGTNTQDRRRLIDLTRQQIQHYAQAARQQGLNWAMA